MCVCVCVCVCVSVCVRAFTSFEQVAPSPKVSFPHAAMTTPSPASTPWLQRLTSALKTLDMGQKSAGLHNAQISRLRQQPQPCVEVFPRCVSPVWENLAKTVVADGRDDSLVAIEPGEDDYVVGGGGCWLLRAQSKAPRF